MVDADQFKLVRPRLARQHDNLIKFDSPFDIYIKQIKKIVLSLDRAPERELVREEGRARLEKKTKNKKNKNNKKQNKKSANNRAEPNRQRKC